MASKFIEFDKNLLAEVAQENLNMGNGKPNTAEIWVDVAGNMHKIQGYYYFHGKLILTDKPVRPRNE